MFPSFAVCPYKILLQYQVVSFHTTEKVSFVDFMKFRYQGISLKLR